MGHEIISTNLGGPSNITGWIMKHFQYSVMGHGILLRSYDRSLTTLHRFFIGLSDFLPTGAVDKVRLVLLGLIVKIVMIQIANIEIVVKEFTIL